MIDQKIEKFVGESITPIVKKGLSIGAIGSHSILINPKDPISEIHKYQIKTLPGFINGIVSENSYFIFLKEFFVLTQANTNQLLDVLKGSSYEKPDNDEYKALCIGVVCSGIICYSIQQNHADPMSVVTSVYESNEEFWGFQNGIPENLKNFIFDIFTDHQIIYRDYL